MNDAVKKISPCISLVATDYRTMTPRWQGTPYFRRIRPGAGFKTAIPLKKSWGGYRRSTPRYRFVVEILPGEKTRLLVTPKSLECRLLFGKMDVLCTWATGLLIGLHFQLALNKHFFHFVEGLIRARQARGAPEKNGAHLYNK